VALQLLQYIPERMQHADRWVTSLSNTQVPLLFINGALDPVRSA